MDNTTTVTKKYALSLQEFDKQSFTPTFIREERRRSLVENCTVLCRKVIEDFGVSDPREQNFLLAKIGIHLTGQGMLPLQEALFKMDQEDDDALKAKFGTISEYTSGNNRDESNIGKGDEYPKKLITRNDPHVFHDTQDAQFSGKDLGFKNEY